MFTSYRFPRPPEGAPEGRPRPPARRPRVRLAALRELPPPKPFEVTATGPRLAAEAAGEGPAVVLLHGLTATRRYVVMGSRALERGGHRVIAYDARGHGESSPAPESSAYEYRHLVEDLEAVLDHAGAERAVVVGASMGAATGMAFALDRPERVAALVQITPAYDGRPRTDPAEREHWRTLADALERDGPDGFLAAYRPSVGGRFEETVRAFTRQRLERHRHPGAVADALRVVPASAAFGGLEQLERVEAPVLVVGSRDEADPDHPLAVAEAYAERLPRAELLVEEPGRPPLAWRGALLSRAILAFLERRGARSR